MLPKATPICQVCGDKGYQEFLIYCDGCRISCQHRYCMDKISKIDELDIHWLCEECMMCSPDIGSANKFCLGLDKKGSNYLTQNKQINYADHSSRKVGNFSKSVNKIVPCLKKKNDLSSASEVAIESGISGYKSARFNTESAITNVGTSNLMEAEGEVGIHSPKECCNETFPRKKRRKLILAEDDQSDEEAQSDVGSDSKYISSSFNIADAVKNIGSSDSMEAEAENGRHSSRRCSKETFPTKKRRKLILEEEDQSDEETLSDHFNHYAHDRRIMQLDEPLIKTTSLVGAEDSTSGANESQIISFVPDIQLSTTYHQPSTEEAFYSAARPFFDHGWRGYFNICNEEYGPLTAHLSTRACDKVHRLVGSLPPVLRVEKLSRLDAWPNSFRKSNPTDDNIGMYFFPSGARVAFALDNLLDDVINNDLVLKVILDEAELLVFSSFILPENNQRFHGKYYAWGVFRPRQVLRPSIQEICIFKSNELAEENNKMLWTEHISEELETYDQDPNSPSLSGNSSNISSSYSFKLFGMEISGRCLSTGSPSELNVEQNIEVHKHAEDGVLAESDAEASDCLSQNGGSTTFSRALALFGQHFPVSSSSGSLSELVELDKEDDHEALEQPEWKKEDLFHDKDWFLSQNKENGCEVEGGRKSIVPLLVTSEDEEDGACIELFPLRVENMAILARVSSNNDLNLKLGVSCR